MKKQTSILALAAFVAFSTISHPAICQLDALKATALKAKNAYKGQSKLSNEDVVNGLKEALNVGTNKSTTAASQTDGFYKNAKIKIPFPAEALEVKNTIDKLGMSSETEKFVETMNRSAEDASKSAAPIFIDAIKNMSLQDGFAILNGGDSAATTYLRVKTTEQLTQALKPIIKAAIEKNEVAKYWSPVVNKYNKIPFTKKYNPDLEAYITQKTLDGLFVLIAEQEGFIRKNPSAQVSDILKRVFGAK